MRTVYLGTSAFAAAVLEHLAAGPHRPQLVVTRPDRPAGRGRRLTAPPVAQAAAALGLETFQPEDVNAPAARARIAEATPEVLIVCAFGALVKQDLLDAHEILNVHPSLLPRWRGAAPIERAIMAGDAETGVCIMRLTAGLDSGPVALTARTPIGPEDTFGTLSERLERLSGPLLVRALDEHGERAWTEQVEDGVTYAEKILAADRTLDPDSGAAAMDRTVRALTPHIGARIDPGDGGEGFLGVLAARPVGPGEGGAHGKVVAQGDRLFYGDLELLRVQPPGGRPMDAADYVRGRANATRP